MTKLTQEDLEKLKRAKAEFGAIEDVFVNRIDEVMCLMQKFFNGEEPKGSWWFSDAPEGSVGNLPVSELCYLDGEICFECNFKWKYHMGVPTSFIFMTDDEIIASLKAEQEAEQKKILKDKAAEEARLKRKEKLKEVKKQVLAKLTKEEREALNA